MDKLPSSPPLTDLQVHNAASKYYNHFRSCYRVLNLNPPDFRTCFRNVRLRNARSFSSVKSERICGASPVISFSVWNLLRRNY